MQESEYISLGILCPSRDLVNDQFQLDWKSDRVANVRALVRDSMEEPRPDELDMTFYFSGRKLKEEEKLKDILTQSMVDRGKIIFHLVIASARSPAEPAIPRHSYFTTTYNRSFLNGSIQQSASSSSAAHGAGSSDSVDSGASSNDSSRYFALNDNDTVDREKITLTCGSQVLTLPSHACLICKVSADEYTVAFAPPQLEQIKSHFSIENDLSTVSINFSPSRTNSPAIEIVEDGAGAINQNVQQPDQQLPNGFNIMANNDFIQLNVNDARLRRALTSFMGIGVKLFFLFCFIAAESTQPLMRMAQCLIAYVVFTLGKRWLDSNGERIRAILENALPHGLPAQVNLENYEHLWRTDPQTANQADEQNANVQGNNDNINPAVEQAEGDQNVDNINHDQQAGGVTQDEEPEIQHIHAVYADHARQQSLASKFYDSGRLLIGSLIPAVHERWLQEEQRRRQEVDRQMEERRRLLERLENEKSASMTETENDESSNEKLGVLTSEVNESDPSDEPLSAHISVGEATQEQIAKGDSEVDVVSEKSIQELRSAWLSKLENSNKPQNSDEGSSEVPSSSNEVPTPPSDQETI